MDSYSRSTFGKGILEVKGNFTQRSTALNSTPYNFDSAGTHKVLLSGSNLQTVSFEDFSTCGFNEFEVADEAFGVNFSTPVSMKIKCVGEMYRKDKIKSELKLYSRSEQLTSDVAIDGDVTFGGGNLKLGRKLLNINGKLTISGGTIDLDGGNLVVREDVKQTNGTFDLNGGKFAINSNLLQTSGYMYLHGGTLNIAGDYDITSSDGINCSYGTIEMANDLDRIIVNGNFIMDSYSRSTFGKGILEIKGNFTQRSTALNSTLYNFNSTGTHKVLLSGSSLQKVTFEDYPNSTFNILAITKPLNTGYSFNKQPVWKTLMEMKDDMEAPTTPANLAVTAKTSSSVSLSWTRSTDNFIVEKYVILRDGDEVGKIAGTSYTDNGLLPNTTYTYRVKAIDGNGNASGLSNEVSVTTDEGSSNPDKPDWYYIDTTDEDGNPIQIYLSDIGGDAGESSSAIRAIAKGSDDVLWKEYLLSGDIWTDTGIAYAEPPGGGIVTTATTTSGKTSMKAGLAGTPDLPRIVKINFDGKKDQILNLLYDKIGIDPNALTEADKKMLKAGIAASFDDNVCFGLLYKIARRSHSDDNYFFMRARAYADAMFVSVYTVTTLGSAAEAARALDTAGLSGGMALATSETGFGGAVFGAAAVAELAETAAMSGISFLSSKMMKRSQNIFKASAGKLDGLVNGPNGVINRTGKMGWSKNAGTLDDFLNSRNYTKTSSYIPGDRDPEMKIFGVFDKNGTPIGEIHENQPLYIDNKKIEGKFYPLHYEAYNEYGKIDNAAMHEWFPEMYGWRP